MNKKAILLTALLMATSVLVGCSSVQSINGQSTTVYSMGTLRGSEPVDINTAFGAAEEAANQLDLNIIDRKLDKMTAHITARDSEDAKTTITLKTTPENTTDIFVRSGRGGDKRKSMLIYQKIQDNLGNKKQQTNRS